MGYRDAAPDGRKDKEGHSILVLPNGTSLAGKYQVSYLGVGGMSVVYKGCREGKTYFIKEVDSRNSQHVISLSQEKFMLERLSHPGIVRIHDFFEQEGFWYLVTDFIEGKSLNRLISPLPDIFIQERIVLDWARQLYDIFEYLHNQKPPIIYRDLKPQNVIRDNDGKIHLVDFGIARTYKEDSIGDTTPMGSFLTASPEHYGGKQTDERSDIYTVGATLHYLLTNGKGRGTDLFDFSPPRNINPKISEKTEKVIMKSLSPDPENRFSSIEEMRKAQFNSASSENMITPPIAEDEDTSKMTKSGRLAREETSGKGKKPEPVDSENVIQSFISFALSQPRLIAAFLVLIVIVTFTTVALRGSGDKKTAAIASPEVSPTPEINSPQEPTAAVDSSSPEPDESLSASPLVPEPGFNVVIGSLTPTAKPTPAVAAVTPAAAPTVASQQAYPMGTATNYRAPAPEPQRPIAAANPQPSPAPSTKEEMLALLFEVKKDRIRPFSGLFVDHEYKYSIRIPSGYYRIISSTKENRFVFIDSPKEPSSLREIIITPEMHEYPKKENGVNTAIGMFMCAVLEKGGTNLENAEIKIKNPNARCDGHYMSYKLTAFPPVSKRLNGTFVHTDFYVVNVERTMVHLIRASAPEESHSRNFKYELQPALDSITVNHSFD